MSIAEKKFNRHGDKQLTLDQENVSTRTRNLPEYYKAFFGLSDCDVCYNPLREDSYADCSFFCPFCFARDKTMSLYSAFFDNWTPDMVRPARVADMEKEFKKAFASSRKYGGTIRAIRQGVPFHVGTLTDPFQAAELKHGVTLGFLKLVKEYDYPIIISTKSAMHRFHPKYERAILDLDKIIIQSSITTSDKKLSKILAPRAPSGMTRIRTLKHFKDAGIQTVARLQPIIPGVTDATIYSTVQDLTDMVDVVNIKDYFISGNKTIRKYWVDTFGVDVWDLYERSEPLEVVGAQRRYNQEKMVKYLIKVKNLINAHDITCNLDSCYGFAFSDQHHCCGGDGVKGFNPKNEWDLQKVGIFNTANVKYWAKILLNEGKVSFDRAFKQLPYESRHEDFIYSRWFWGKDLVLMGLIEDPQREKDTTIDHEDIVYKFEPSEHYEICSKLLDDRVELEADERLLPAGRYYDV